MRKLVTFVVLCVALGSASPSRAGTIDIGNISLVDFGFGAEVRIENTTFGTAVEDAFTDLLLTVDFVEYGFGRINAVDPPDFHDPLLAGFVFESVLAGMGVSLFHPDPFSAFAEATVTFSFGGQLVRGGGTLVLFEQPISLVVTTEDEGTTPVPEPGGTLTLFGMSVLALAGGAGVRRSKRSFVV